MTRQAIDANAAALKGRAPDLVKGGDVAFGSFTGSDMTQWDTGTAEAYVQHLNHLREQSTNPALSPQQQQDFTKKLRESISSFNTSSEDIARSADLQGSFKSSVGLMITEKVQGMNPADLAALQAGLARITSEGKIRQP